ncbi:MAG: diacylglycerol kinase family protein [Erysipelotrichaceae bacterium]
MKDKFKVSFKGLIGVFSHGSFLIQVILGILTCIFFAFLKISYVEWLLVIMLITLVLVCEFINTIIEMIIDLYTPYYDEKAGKIKDFASGMVLLSCIFSLIVGLLIVLHHMEVWL